MLPNLKKLLITYIIAFAQLANISVAAESALQYRVAGIVLTPEKRLVMIEASDGTQQLYRRGDSLDGFDLMRIEDDGIVLKKGASQVFLELEGTPTRLEDVAAALSTSMLMIADGQASQALDYQKAARELDVLSRQGSGAEGSAGQRVATVQERLNMALGLPTHTVISSVDRDRVIKPEHAVLLLTQKISRGDSVRLEVGGTIPGIDVLYLTPVANEPTG